MLLINPTQIEIGDRVRKDVDRNIDGLCRSIRSLGQLQPIVVDADLRLIAGLRRLRACELLGVDVAYVVADNLAEALKRLQAERDENNEREPFTPSEAVEMGKRLEALLKPEAEKRQAHGTTAPGKPANASGKLPEALTGDTRDKVGEAVGLSGRTYEKAKAVVAEASKPDAKPEVKAAAQQMDATGKVDPAYRAVKAATEPVKPKPVEPVPAPKPAAKWRIEDDMVEFQNLFDSLRPNWEDPEHKELMRALFRQMAKVIK